jgi:hypothetical protein
MTKWAMAGAAAAMLSASAVAVGAQTKTVQGKTERMTVTVEAIDSGRRQVTVKKPDGNFEVLYVPADVKKFDTLKVGDKITANYYENMVLRVAPPGSAPRDESSAGVTRAETGTAGTAAHQRTITATIAAIDMKVPSITFTGPNNWKYSTKVQDKDALSKVKVGDKVDITWTEAMVVSLDQ